MTRQDGKRHSSSRRHAEGWSPCMGQLASRETSVALVVPTSL
jgi:hypothetical protein